MESKTTEENIIAAMDGKTIEIVKYLPYILQDFWEIGSSPEEIIKLIKKHKINYSSLNVLDLGSGKGAVSIKIASELKCNCFGIDAIEDFVIFSNEKSKEYSVNSICTFETNDIRTRLKSLEKYDIIILGAIGPVFGNYYDTLSQLSFHLNNGGLIIVDDAFVEDDCKKDYPNVLKKTELLTQINNAGMELIEKLTIDDIPETTEDFDNQFQNIQNRCMELIKKLPGNKELFLEYIESQKSEYDILKNEIIPAMFVIKKME
jgi:cyclopropane fatty-acyl-phospholipid synthase-like methyltransferase